MKNADSPQHCFLRACHWDLRRGEDIIKNTANVITSFRIIFAVAMLLSAPFTTVFWVCYIMAGVSDMLDGWIARRLGQASDFGARLDSAADFIFACAIIAVIAINVDIPGWMWIWAALIALLRFLSYATGYCKYHQIPALHTYANKIAGLVIFLFPLMYPLLGIKIGGIILCTLATGSAVEELLIVIKTKQLDRDCKSIFSAKSNSDL